MSHGNDFDMNRLLNSLLQEPTETEWLEFKEAKTGLDSREMGKYFSALSNEARLVGRSCGWLVLGVSDKHEIVGTGFRNDPAKLESLKQEISRELTGGITFQAIHELNLSAGRVLIFQIPAAPSGIPIAFQGHWYGRNGESLVALSIEKVERIRALGRAVDWTGEIVEGIGVGALDARALAEARDAFRHKHQNRGFSEKMDHWDDRTFCDRAKLTRGGKVTRAALLLLGKPESAHHLGVSLPQITWKLEGAQKAYEHFGPPFFLTVNDLYSRIRNLKQKIMPVNRLIPFEVDAYEKWVVLEGLHNCLAHQDYARVARVIVTERPDRLVFENSGEFFEGNVEDYTSGSRTPSRYRNPCLAEAMMNLNMIDTMGYGIHRMFTEQRKRHFPMPDYDLSEAGKVKLTIYGRMIDENYTKLLMEATDLPLSTVILLDRVQKKMEIPRVAATALRKDGLVEGRWPNLFVTAHVAESTGKKAEYLRHRAFDDGYYKKLIMDYLEKFKTADRADIDRLLDGKYSDVLDDKQRENKTRNILQALRREGRIVNEGSRIKPKWIPIAKNSGASSK